MGSYNSDKKNAKFFGLKLSRNTDADIIAWLESRESVQGYLKSLIRADMKGAITMKYQINLTDSNGATSAIDTVEAHAGYTAAEYLAGCRENADPEWVEMLEAGTVSVEQIDD